MSTERDARPYIVVTAILDGSARAAAVTMSHGDAMERALSASADQAIAGLEIVELAVTPQAFSALRTHAGLGDDAVAVYDVFPLNAALDTPVRTVAGQFLAAEALWALEEIGQLSGVPLNLKLTVPRGWERDPKSIHEKLIGAGALELGPEAIDTFRSIKTGWDAPAAS
ncbi:MAG: hypothetical protein H6719_32650 [Sandaracinaceae bacterium]|nr:hypothetical protein [Sandaracinaceae bacterium]